MKKYLSVFILLIAYILLNVIFQREGVLYNGRDAIIWGFPITVYFKYSVQGGFIQGWVIKGLIYNTLIAIVAAISYSLWFWRVKKSRIVYSTGISVSLVSKHTTIQFTSKKTRAKE